MRIATGVGAAQAQWSCLSRPGQAFHWIRRVPCRRAVAADAFFQEHPLENSRAIRQFAACSISNELKSTVYPVQGGAVGAADLVRARPGQRPNGLAPGRPSPHPDPDAIDRGLSDGCRPSARPHDPVLCEPRQARHLRLPATGRTGSLRLSRGPHKPAQRPRCDRAAIDRAQGAQPKAGTISDAHGAIVLPDAERCTDRVPGRAAVRALSRGHAGRPGPTHALLCAGPLEAADCGFSDPLPGLDRAACGLARQPSTSNNAGSAGNTEQLRGGYCPFAGRSDARTLTAFMAGTAPGAFQLSETRLGQPFSQPIGARANLRCAHCRRLSGLGSRTRHIALLIKGSTCGLSPGSSSTYGMENSLPAATLACDLWLACEIPLVTLHSICRRLGMHVNIMTRSRFNCTAQWLHWHRKICMTIQH